MTNAEKLAKDTEVMTDLVLGTLSPCYSCIYENDVDGCESHDCRPSIKKWLKSEAEE